METKKEVNPYTKKPVQIEGCVFFLFGTTGTGKTTWIKDKLRQIPLPKYLFDLDNEFIEFGKSFPIDRKKSLQLHADNFKNFVAPFWESCFVFSEAGMFFNHSNAMDLQMREILKSARRRGNFVFFDFHSLSEIPIGMLKFCNFLVMKKTAMETKQQIQKFAHYPLIIDNYKSVMRSKNNFETIIVKPREMQIDF